MKRSVMIVGAGVMQVPAIQEAKKLGLCVIASDKNPNAPGLALADVPLVLDIKDAAGHAAWAKANKEKLGIKGAFAGADVAITVAAIAEAAGLPGIPPEVARRSNNKWLMKQRWLKDGIATPYAEEVRTVAEARSALRKTGLPAMIKAIDNAASRGTRRIDAESELEDALEDAKRHSTTGTALVEEFVEGVEQSVEYVADGKTHHRFGVVDRHFEFEPFPIEVGHTNPSQLSVAECEKLYRLVRDAAVSLGINWGPYKADTILTKKGPMILELPARLSGGFHSQYTTPLATGMNPIRAALRLAVGEPFEAEDARVKSARVAHCAAIFPPPGRVERIDGLEEAKHLPGVEHIFLLVSPGETIPPYRNCANRVCYAIVSGEDAAQALARFHELNETLKIVTLPAAAKEML